jgi:TolB protein
MRFTAAAGVLAVASPGSASPRQQEPHVGSRKPSGIFVLNVRTNARHVLVRATLGVVYDSPAWAPDGQRLAFSGSYCDDCQPMIFFVRRAGSGLHALKVAIPAERPSWAPDGKGIVFIGGVGSGQIYTVRPDGRELRLIRGGPYAHDQAVWAPRGDRIVFTTQQRNGRWDLYVMDANGSHVRALTRTPEAEEQPAWSPDGRRIAFIRQLHGRWSIWVMDADGRNQRRLTYGGNAENPSWSPDGRAIAFADVGPKYVRLFVMRADGRGVRALRTGIGKSFTPAWSPRGDALAFAGVRATGAGS